MGFLPTKDSNFLPEMTGLGLCLLPINTVVDYLGKRDGFSFTLPLFNLVFKLVLVGASMSHIIDDRIKLKNDSEIEKFD
jgi:hypothetical protein